MEYKLFLDDIRNPKDVLNYIDNDIYSLNNWVIVRNYDEFVQTIEKNGLPTIISFDHDLAYDHYLDDNQNGDIDYDNLTEKTGYDCAKWLVDYCIIKMSKITSRCYVHSMNPVGKVNIETLLHNFNKHINYVK